MGLQPELIAVLYPVFVHFYLDLVTDDYYEQGIL